MLKFDETDRIKVISEVEKHLSTKLSRVGKYRKFLQDQFGRSYWVLGGYEDWHGISSDMLEEQQRRDADGVLVVAKRHKSTIDIFSGPLQPLIANYRDLSHTKAGHYQFNVAIRGNSMTINEVQGLTLRKLGAPQEAGTAADPNFEEVMAIVAKMSPGERSRLLERLSEKSRG